MLNGWIPYGFLGERRWRRLPPERLGELGQEQRYAMFQLTRRHERPRSIGEFLPRPRDDGVTIAGDEFVKHRSLAVDGEAGSMWPLLRLRRCRQYRRLNVAANVPGTRLAFWRLVHQSRCQFQPVHPWNVSLDNLLHRFARDQIAGRSAPDTRSNAAQAQLAEGLGPTQPCAGRPAVRGRLSGSRRHSLLKPPAVASSSANVRRMMRCAASCPARQAGLASPVCNAVRAVSIQCAWQGSGANRGPTHQGANGGRVLEDRHESSNSTQPVENLCMDRAFPVDRSTTQSYGASRVSILAGMLALHVALSATRQE